MAIILKVREKSASYFEFEIGGEIVYENTRNDLTVVNNKCHFKGANGANILKRQDIEPNQVEVISAADVSTFPASVPALFGALKDINYFAWFGNETGGPGGSGVNKFADLLDAFGFAGNNGKVPVVNEAQNRLDAEPFYNYSLFTQLQDVAVSTLSAAMAGKRIGVEIVEGLPKLVLVDAVGDQNTLFNEMLFAGEITRDVNEFTIPAGDAWRINGEIYSNQSEFVFEIPEAAAGMNRIDIVVARDDNSFLVVSGTEGAGIAAMPERPANTVIRTIINVVEAEVGEPEPPVVGDIYITKASKNTIMVGQNGVINNLYRDYRTHYTFKTSGLEVRGFAGAAGFMNGDNTYQNQKFTLYNSGAGDVTLKHFNASGEIRFFFPDANDFVLKPGYTVEFYFVKDTIPVMRYIGVSTGGAAGYELHIDTDVDLTAASGVITVPAGFVPTVVSLNKGRVLDLGSEYEMTTATQLTVLYAFEAGDTVSISGIKPTT